MHHKEEKIVSQELSNNFIICRIFLNFLWVVHIINQCVIRCGQVSDRSAFFQDHAMFDSFLAY